MQYGVRVGDEEIGVEEATRRGRNPLASVAASRSTGRQRTRLTEILVPYMVLALMAGFGRLCQPATIGATRGWSIASRGPILIRSGSIASATSVGSELAGLDKKVCSSMEKRTPHSE